MERKIKASSLFTTVHKLPEYGSAFLATRGDLNRPLASAEVSRNKREKSRGPRGDRYMSSCIRLRPGIIIIKNKGTGGGLNRPLTSA